VFPVFRMVGEEESSSLTLWVLSLPSSLARETVCARFSTFRNADVPMFWAHVAELNIVFSLLDVVDIGVLNVCDIVIVEVAAGVVAVNANEGRGVEHVSSVTNKAIEYRYFLIDVIMLSL